MAAELQIEMESESELELETNLEVGAKCCSQPSSCCMWKCERVWTEEVVVACDRPCDISINIS